MTLVELIVAFTILMLLSAMAVPLARSRVRKIKEHELREALHEMRAAIDKYKDYGRRRTSSVPRSRMRSATRKVCRRWWTASREPGQGADTKIKFLRRIPHDPMTNTNEWGMRSMQDDPKISGWGGQNVFDVHTKSDQKGAGWNPLCGVVSVRGVAQAGFTLIELMIVMAIIVTLHRDRRARTIRSRWSAPKRSVLKSNLFTMRQMIDEYSFDKQKAPQTLQDLVSEGYLREVPKDPMTGNNTTWKLIMEDPAQSVNQQEPGIWDVRSGSDRNAMDGSPYGEWRDSHRCHPPGHSQPLEWSDTLNDAEYQDRRHAWPRNQQPGNDRGDDCRRRGCLSFERLAQHPGRAFHPHQNDSRASQRGEPSRRAFCWICRARRSAWASSKAARAR